MNYKIIIAIKLTDYSIINQCAIDIQGIIKNVELPQQQGVTVELNNFEEQTITIQFHNSGEKYSSITINIPKSIEDSQQTELIDTIMIKQSIKCKYFIIITNNTISNELDSITECESILSQEKEDPEDSSIVDNTQFDSTEQTLLNSMCNLIGTFQKLYTSIVQLVNEMMTQCHTYQTELQQCLLLNNQDAQLLQPQLPVCSCKIYEIRHKLAQETINNLQVQLAEQQVLNKHKTDVINAQYQLLSNNTQLELITHNQQYYRTTTESKESINKCDDY